MKRLSASDHDKLQRATTDATRRISAGEPANEAVEKAAAAAGLPPGGASLLASAVNVGRQLAYRESNADALDKFAAFDLADPMAGDSAYAAPASEKIAADYAGPPTWTEEKKSHLLHHASATPLAAAAPAVDPLRVLLAKKAQLKAIDQDRRFALADADQSLEKLAVELGTKGWTPEQTKLAAVVYYDAESQDLFKAAFERRGWDWDKTAKAKTTPTFHELAGPFPAFRVCCEKIAAARRKQAGYDEAYAALEKAAEEAAPLFAASSPEPGAGDGDKEAGLLGLGALNFASALGPRTLPEGMTHDERLSEVSSLADKLETPSFENERRRIAAQALLAEAMTDERDPLSGYDPDSVLHAYNELAKLAPTISTQPAVMKPLLARWLGGNQQPFEVKEVAALEQQMRSLGRPDQPAGK